VVTERYGKPGARFEVETPTAIAGWRGTGFIATYDIAKEQTVVVGLFDTTFVRSRAEKETGHEVELGPGQATTVRRGSYPLRPSPMPDDVLQGLGAETTVSSSGGGGATLAAPALNANVRPRAARPKEEASRAAAGGRPVGEAHRQGHRAAAASRATTTSLMRRFGVVRLCLVIAAGNRGATSARPGPARAART